ncbi:TonB-dependent receptor [Fodinibius salsisoli]|uniref:TonB-dependent receptor n=1 Tax=Fodinibius salsisoli TaxID=2820877 RepID=A0ABT3PL82_9BACT|nr:TonB-dependent receptor [Fodinibius salsisoli]MCW9705969.1 TonB-dependent receptor [Fodinibius salsisoli]
MDEQTVKSSGLDMTDKEQRTDLYRISIQIILVWMAVCVLVLSAQGQERQEGELPVASAGSIELMFDEQVTSDIDHESVLNNTISLHLNEVSVLEGIKKIASKADLKLSYNTQLTSLDKKVTLEMEDGTIEDALWKVLRGTNLRFAVSANGQLVLINRQSKLQVSVTQEQVAGTVTDSQSGETLPAVNVSVKGTTTGISTDSEGRFELTVPSLQDTLMFSFVGYQTKEEPINGRTKVNVALEPKVVEGDEVVVTAFGEEERREDVVGAVTSVSANELAEVPTSNLTTTLAGRASGIISYQRSGEPGQDNAQFFVRGVTSFGYKKDPLILIDGIESSSTDLARLQPDNIENFSILKDATSTAVYGSRAANGVILVRTKEGRPGSTQVDFRLENSISMPTEEIQFADPVQYMRLNNEAVATRDPLGVRPYSLRKIDKTEAGANPYLYPATNWKDDLFKDHTMNQRLHLDISGGGDVANYYVAGAVNQDNGVLKVDPINNYNSNIDLKSYSLRTNVDVKLSENTQLDTKLSGSFDDYTGPLKSGTEIYEMVARSNPVRFPAVYPKTENTQYVNHILYGNYEAEGGGFMTNPYAEMVKGYRNYSRTNLNAQFGIKHNFSFIKNLTLDARVFVSRYSYFEIQRSTTPYWYEASPALGGSRQSFNLNLLNEDEGNPSLRYNPESKQVSSDFKLQSKLRYSNTLAEKHSIGGLLVFRMRNELEGSPTDLQTSLPQRNLGISGSATYNYDSRYYATFNFGYNGSERFDKSHRFGFFPSLGLSWNISNENFWEPLSKAITNLKIRATYGLVGNDAIGNPSDRFLYLSNVNIRDNSQGYTFGRERNESLPGVSISRYGNSAITWEEGTKIDVGIRLGLFDQFELEADYFEENRNNILMSRESIPTSMGLSATPQANIGAAKSHGFDASLNYSKFLSRDFYVKLRGNFTYATNKYTKYEENDYSDTPWKSRIGNPIDQVYGYIAERLFVDDNEAANSPEQSFGEYGGGDIKYRDVNGDGRITKLDQVPLGYPTTPEIVYGFGFSLGYKSFDLSAFFQGSARSSFWINASGTAPFVGGNQLLKAYADDHWSREDQDVYALWPRLSANNSAGNENNFQRSTWFMRDGSFLRLKQLELGYNLPLELTESLSMRNLRVYLTGSNLLTFSKFKLWDPEMAGNGLGYPVQRVFSAGIKASF